MLERVLLLRRAERRQRIMAYNWQQKPGDVSPTVSLSRGGKDHHCNVSTAEDQLRVRHVRVDSSTANRRHSWPQTPLLMLLLNLSDVYSTQAHRL